MVTTKLNLSMTEPQVRQIYAKQGDTGRVLDITLDQTPEDGTLRILRPDGTEVTSEAVTGGEVESGGTFESLTEADVTELTVGIEPVQDLNGQSAPYPAGGGRNKLANNYSSGAYSGVTFTANSDGSVTMVGTVTENLDYYFVGSYSPSYADVGVATGEYKFRVAYSGTFTGTIQTYVVKNGGSIIASGNVGNGISTIQIDSASTYRIFIRAFNGTNMSGGITIYPMLWLASETDNTWQPYSNICPITGHDEVRVYDDPVYGKTIMWNQLFKSGSGGVNSNVGTKTYDSTTNTFTVTNSTSASWLGVYTLRANVLSTPNHKYLIFVKATNTVATNLMFGTDTSHKVQSGFTANTEKVCTAVINPTTSTSFIFYFNNASSVKFRDIQIFDLTLMFGSTIADYVYSLEQSSTGSGLAWLRSYGFFTKDYYPYNAGEETTVSAVNGDPNRQYTTSLGQTVYGGTLDMVSGVLTVTHAIVDLGSLTWSLNSSLNGKPAFYVRLYDAKTVLSSAVADMTTSCYSVISADNLYIQKDNTGIIALNEQNYLQVRDTRYSTASAYKSGITGQTLVYELATPQTYTLTAQQIKTLVGTNNVWASSGDIVSIKFTYGGLLSELPSEATEIVGKCYCDVEQNGVSSMPFTLNVKKNERES